MSISGSEEEDRIAIFETGEVAPGDLEEIQIEAPRDIRIKYCNLGISSHQITNDTLMLNWVFYLGLKPNLSGGTSPATHTDQDLYLNGNYMTTSQDPAAGLTGMAENSNPGPWDFSNLNVIWSKDQTATFQAAGNNVGASDGCVALWSVIYEEL